ncbi:MAG TPA: hypothetical protein VIY08_13175 [Candidatus Nitrosocosmicus sp.]
MLYDKETGYRVKIILLKADGYTVLEIRRATNHHDVNIQKWIHLFKEKGLEGMVLKIHFHKPIKITSDMKKRLLKLMTKNPRMDYGLPFPTWSLRMLAGFITKKINMVESIIISN